jgi:hypothetical protein
MVNNIIQPYKESLEEYQTVQLGTVTQTMPFTRIPGDFILGEQPGGCYAAQVVADAFEKSEVVYVVPLIEHFRDELENSVLPVLDTGEYCLKSTTTL